MNADDFAAAVALLPPEREEFIRSLPDALRAGVHADRIVNGFYFRPTNIASVFDGYDELIRLILRHDMTSFDSFGIQFLEEPIDINGGIQIGDEQGMPLAIEPKRGEIVVLDDDEDLILSRCARDGSHFLDALLPLVARHKLQFAGKINMIDDAYRDDLINRCTMAAGGMRYHSYYKGRIR